MGDGTKTTQKVMEKKKQIERAKKKENTKRQKRGRGGKNKTIKEETPVTQIAEKQRISQTEAKRGRKREERTYRRPDPRNEESGKQVEAVGESLEEPSDGVKTSNDVFVRRRKNNPEKTGDGRETPSEELAMGNVNREEVAGIKIGSENEAKEASVEMLDEERNKAERQPRLEKLGARQSTRAENHTGEEGVRENCSMV